MSKSIIERMVDWGRRNSLNVFFYQMGGCSMCSVNKYDMFAPNNDFEHMGLRQCFSPRQADILMCSGALNSTNKDSLLSVYEQIPEPKFVIALGACACTGGIFEKCYNVVGGVDSVLPVDLYIPGCPVNAASVSEALEALIEKWEFAQQEEEE